jgi:hypothetical protein
MSFKISLTNESRRNDQSHKPPLNSLLYITDVRRFPIERAETVELLSIGGSDVHFAR